jgi:hypothetical protein
MSRANSDSLDHLIAGSDAIRSDLIAFYEDRIDILSFRSRRNAPPQRPRSGCATWATPSQLESDVPDR